MNHPKEIGIALGTALLTILAVLLIELTVRQPDALSGWMSFVATAVVLIWTATVACAYAFLHGWKAGKWLVSSLIAAAVVLAGLFSLPALVAAGLLFIFVASSAQMITTATRERITFNLRATFLPGIRVIVAGAAVAVAVLLLPTIQQHVTTGAVEIPGSSFAFVLQPATPLLANFIPGYSKTSTIDELIDAQLRQQQPGASALPAAQKDQVRRQLAKTIGVPLTGSETVADVLARSVNGYVRQLAGKGGVLVMIVLAVIGLLIIRTTVPFVAWLAFGVVALLFWLARMTGLVTIASTSLPVERLQL